MRKELWSPSSGLFSPLSSSEAAKMSRLPPTPPPLLFRKSFTKPALFNAPTHLSRHNCCLEHYRSAPKLSWGCFIPSKDLLSNKKEGKSHEWKHTIPKPVSPPWTPTAGNAQAQTHFHSIADRFRWNKSLNQNINGLTGIQGAPAQTPRSRAMQNWAKKASRCKKTLNFWQWLPKTFPPSPSLPQHLPQHSEIHFHSSWYPMQAQNQQD